MSAMDVSDYKHTIIRRIVVNLFLLGRSPFVTLIASVPKSQLIIKDAHQLIQLEKGTARRIMDVLICGRENG